MKRCAFARSLHEAAAAIVFYKKVILK